jgi:nucleoside 2-deoxyribosyltransferase
MSTLQQCPICQTKPTASQRRPTSAGSWFLDCPRCGKFEIIDLTIEELQGRKVDLRLVSAWIRQQNEQGVFVNLRRDDAERLAALQFPTFKERMESYLLAAAKESTSLVESFSSGAPHLLGAAYCETPNELGIIVRHLVNEGYLENRDGPTGQRARLAPKGHMYADELRSRRAASSQGFIAMWFDASMEDAGRNGFEPGIRNAGYKPHRVDGAEHIDKIDDRIIAEIRRSRFLVADLTEHRNNVYYEAGFAAGLDKPVFYTCRADHAEEIHFDIRQFNYIKWDTPAELAERLQARIEAVLGAGPEQR